jgi:hypothetical protein
MKITAFWDMMLCSQTGTNVSEEHAASSFRIAEVE